MEERVEISILVDIYGELLTEKQKEIMALYFNEDLSLSEISEITNTSRQAIHDIIKRCHKLLVEYERKLCLLKKATEGRKLRDELAVLLNELRSLTNSENSNNIILKIEEKIDSYLWEV
jgi:hypothetical protein